MKTQETAEKRTIARLWAARAGNAESRRYLEHFSNEVLPALRRVKGYLGSTVYTQPQQGEVEILVTTIWESLQAIEGFAGADREQAVVTAEAAALLRTYDRRVRHFEIACQDEIAFG